MEETLKAFEQYVHSANFSGPHPSDEERFYGFVITSYKNKTKVNPDKFAEIIKKEAPSLEEDRISEYYSRYERGLDLLRVYETGSITG